MFKIGDVSIEETQVVALDLSDQTVVMLLKRIALREYRKVATEQGTAEEWWANFENIVVERNQQNCSFGRRSAFLIEGSAVRIRDQYEQIPVAGIGVIRWMRGSIDHWSVPDSWSSDRGPLPEATINLALHPQTPDRFSQIVWLATQGSQIGHKLAEKGS